MRRLLVVLLTVDVALIALDALWGAAAMADLLPGRPYLVQINHDFGIAECFNLVKWALAAWLLFTLSSALQRRVWRPAAWAMVLMLCDDALMIHERVTRLVHHLLADRLGGMTSAMVGELGFVILLALAVFGLLFLSRRRARPAGKAHASTFILLMIALGFFGVGVDQIQSLLKNAFHNHLLNSIFAILENGGEMIVISLIAVHALRTRLWAISSPATPA